jgi:hypothetical protein
MSLRFGGSQLQANPGKKLVMHPSQLTVGCSCMCLSSQSMWEAEIRMFTISGRPRSKKKCLRPHINVIKLGVMVCACHPSNGNSLSGSKDQENRSSKPARANSAQDPTLEKTFTKKGLVEWFKL